MARGMMRRPPTGGGLTELTPRQQRRQQYLERRGRQFRPGGQVQAQPTEMPELTARQQRRQQYLARRDARQQRGVEDYRAQQAAQQAGQQLGGFPGLPSTPGGFQPYPLQLSPEQIAMFRDRLGQGIPFNPNTVDMTPNLGQLPTDLAGGMGQGLGNLPNGMPAPTYGVPSGMAGGYNPGQALGGMAGGYNPGQALGGMAGGYNPGQALGGVAGGYDPAQTLGGAVGGFNPIARGIRKLF